MLNTSSFDPPSCRSDWALESDGWPGTAVLDRLPSSRDVCHVPRGLAKSLSGLPDLVEIERGSKSMHHRGLDFIKDDVLWLAPGCQ